MKRISSIIMTFVLLFYTVIPVYASEIQDTKIQTEEGKRLMEYVQEGYERQLLQNDNYAYERFIDSFNESVSSLYLIGMADFLTGCGKEPDVNKYLEVLTNIIGTYDLSNAESIAEQKKMDNLKSVEDYAMDCAEIAQKTISVMSGNGEIENAYQTAISGLDVLTDNTEQWIDAYSNLGAIVQDYSYYDEFLEVIEKNASGDLKEAAAVLRRGMKKAFQIKMATYDEISSSNLENYEEFFFSDILFGLIKELPEYAEDETLSFFVDAGDSLVSKAFTLKDSWELGVLIGTLVGDITVGTSDLTNRTIEIMALQDIGKVLKDELFRTFTDHAENFGTENEKKLAERYVVFSQFMIGCRIRGEYCLYSIIAHDASFLSVFNMKSSEDAEEYYRKKCSELDIIREKLNNIIEDDLDTDVNYDDTAERYSAYAQIVQQYESKYGTVTVTKLNDRNSRMTGLCFLKLIDFDHNGKEELLLVYQKYEQMGSELFPVYTYEIWGYLEKGAVLLDSGEPFGTDGGVKHVYLAEYEGQTYLVTGSCDDFGYYYYHGYLNDTFGIVREVIWDVISGGERSCSINGASVSSEVLDAEQNKWLANLVEYNLNYDCDIVLEQINETKRKLAPYFISEDQSGVNGRNPEIKEEAEGADSNDGFSYFINEKSYLEYVQNWELPVYGYCLIDINQDGENELILSSDERELFAEYQVYAQNGSNINLIKDFWAYCGVYYSNINKAIAFSEVRRSLNYATTSFYSFDGVQLNADFDVTCSVDGTGIPQYMKIPGKDIALSEEEYNAYLSELVLIDEWIEID